VAKYEGKTGTDVDAMLANITRFNWEDRTSLVGTSPPPDDRTTTIEEHVGEIELE